MAAGSGENLTKFKLGKSKRHKGMDHASLLSPSLFILRYIMSDGIYYSNIHYTNTLYVRIKYHQERI